jgi:hypothetical protein
MGSWDSSVGIVMGWTAGFDSRLGQEIFIFSTASRPALGPSQPIRWAPQALYRRVMQLGREADHSLPASVKVKNGEAIPPLSHMFSWHVY